MKRLSMACRFLDSTDAVTCRVRGRTAGRPDPNNDAAQPRVAVCHTVIEPGDLFKGAGALTKRVDLQYADTIVRISDLFLTTLID